MGDKIVIYHDGVQEVVDSDEIKIYEPFEDKDGKEEEKWENAVTLRK